ncbi:hypothetical protein ACFQV4_13915 [Streptomyces thermocarboxydus]
MAQGADAYVHFLGRRERLADGGVEVDVVHAVQYQTGRPLTEWRSLGNPHRTPEKAALLGAPRGGRPVRRRPRLRTQRGRRAHDAQGGTGRPMGALGRPAGAGLRDG